MLLPRLALIGKLIRRSRTEYTVGTIVLNKE